MLAQRVLLVRPVSRLWDSSTFGEDWKVFGSNLATPASLGSALLSGTDELSHLLPGTFKFYFFMVASSGYYDNVLLNSISASTTPLPAVLPLMGSVLGAGYWVSRWRRRR